MPPRYARIASIQPTDNIEELVRAFNARIAELNDVFADLEKAESITRGSGGQQTTFDSDVNVNNFRLTNVSPSRAPQDAVTRKELDAIGLLPDTTGELNIQAPVNFTQRVSTEAPTSNDGASMATIGDIVGLIEQALENNVAASRDGDRVSVEDGAGTNGITDGTLAMARDGITGKARMLKAINDGLVVESPSLVAMFELLIQEIRELKIELNNPR